MEDYLNDSTRSISPPPPPPPQSPPLSSSRINRSIAYSDQRQTGESDNKSAYDGRASSIAMYPSSSEKISNESTAAAESYKKPFLRKGSRKEPTALNRVPVTTTSPRPLPALPLSTNSNRPASTVAQTMVGSGRGGGETRVDIPMGDTLSSEPRSLSTTVIMNKLSEDLDEFEEIEKRLEDSAGFVGLSNSSRRVLASTTQPPRNKANDRSSTTATTVTASTASTQSNSGIEVSAKKSPKRRSSGDRSSDKAMDVSKVLSSIESLRMSVSTERSNHGGHTASQYADRYDSDNDEDNELSASVRFIPHGRIPSNEDWDSIATDGDLRVLSDSYQLRGISTTSTTGRIQSQLRESYTREASASSGTSARSDKGHVKSFPEGRNLSDSRNGVNPAVASLLQRANEVAANRSSSSMTAAPASITAAASIRSSSGAATTLSTGSDGVVRSRPKIPIRGTANDSAANSSSNARPLSATKQRLTRGQQSKEASQSRDFLPDDVAAKAKELEAELETYKQETAALKEARKKQETVLNEVLKERAEVLKWATEERRKVEDYCQQQRQIIAKEQKLANSKLAQARLLGQTAVIGSNGENGASTPSTSHGATLGFPSTSIRKERAEIEALQATIEKMKVDFDQQTKKLKANEKRLLNLTRENNVKIEQLEGQIKELDTERLMVWAFLDKIGLNLPTNMLRLRQKSGYHPDDRGLLARKKGLDSYVEEVIVDSEDYAHEDDGRGGFDGEEEDSQRTSESLQEATANENYYQKSKPVDNGGRSKVESVESRGSHPTDTSYSHLPKNGGTFVPSGLVEKAISTELFGMSPHRLFGQSSFSPSSTKASSRYASISHDKHYEEAAAVGSDRREQQPEHFSGTKVAVESKIVASTDTTLKPKDSSRTHSTGEKLQSVPALPRPSGDSATTTTTLIANADNGNNITSTNGSGGRTEELLEDGRKRIYYKNGTVKEVHPDGRTMVRFLNGDTKRSNPQSGIIVYFYFEAKTTHTSYPDGLEVYEFPNGQVERHYPDGKKEIYFPDKTKKIIYANGCHESHFADGVVVKEYPSGEREVVTAAQ